MPDYPSNSSGLVVVPLGPPADDTRPLLGLTPAARLRLSAARAGLAVCEPDAPLPEAGGYFVVAGDILAERGWASDLADLEVGHWARAGDAVLALPAEARAALVSARDGGADVAGLAAWLEKRYGPPNALPLAPLPMRLEETDAGRRAAERRLLRGLVKDTDGFLAKHIARPISLAVSRRLAPTAITPNQMTLITGAIGLIAAPFFLSSAAWLQAIGGALFLLHSILDGCDGELARLKYRESRWGGLLDFWGDNVVHVAVFGCMAFGWAGAVGAWWPLLFGAGAVLGTIGSASLVHWRVLAPKAAPGPVYTSVAAGEGNRLSGLLDGLSRRDFIYLVFVLSLFGKASWFLAVAGVGTPVFLGLLLFLAWREGRSSAG